MLISAKQQSHSIINLFSFFNFLAYNLCVSVSYSYITYVLHWNGSQRNRCDDLRKEASTIENDSNIIEHNWSPIIRDCFAAEISNWGSYGDKLWASTSAYILEEDARISERRRVPTIKNDSCTIQQNWKPILRLFPDWNSRLGRLGRQTSVIDLVRTFWKKMPKSQKGGKCNQK